MVEGKSCINSRTRATVRVISFIFFMLQPHQKDQEAAGPRKGNLPARLHLPAYAFVVQFFFPRLRRIFINCNIDTKEQAASAPFMGDKKINRALEKQGKIKCVVITCFKLCFLASLRRLSFRCKLASCFEGCAFINEGMQEK